MKLANVTLVFKKKKKIIDQLVFYQQFVLLKVGKKV